MKLLAGTSLSLAGFLPVIILLTACDVKRPPQTATDTVAPEVRWAPVSITNGWFHVGGEKFLVVGVGYEIGARPGRLPWTHDHQPEILRADFERIVAAGFNTLRTWAPMTDAELEIAAEFGLWVLQGLWYDVAADFNDPAFREETLNRIAQEVTRSARHPNILGYLLGNEPHADAVWRAGRESVYDFHRQLVETARRCDPNRPLSYANCVATDFMIPDMWDFVAHNTYPYSPVTIEKALGYRGYLDWVQATLAKGKPLVVTEFGLSVSPTGDGRGYGGNTLEQQRDGVVALWHDILNAGCAGGCAFMWIDGWWKYRDEHTHDDHAEEWYGLLEADSDYVGKPRPVYHALREANRAIRTSPLDQAFSTGEIQVEVWAPASDAVEYRIDDGEWQPLRREGAWWWRASARVPADVLRWINLQTRSQQDGSWTVSVHPCRLRIGGLPRADPLGILFAEIPESVRAGSPLRLRVQVKSWGERFPIDGRMVRLAVFRHTGWYEWVEERATDADGFAAFEVNLPPEPGILSVAAALEYEAQESPRRAAAYRHVDITR